MEDRGRYVMRHAMNKNYLVPLLFLLSIVMCQSQVRLRDHGIEIGVLKTGPLNAITDVPGVKVGHQTLHKGDTVRTGVTAILPHEGNLFQEKVPAAIYVGNGFGKLAGYTQVKELGNLETPIVLTNTLSVATAVNAVIGHTLQQPDNETVRSVNAVVGETNDGYLNDIRGRHVTEDDVLRAIAGAGSGAVQEGNLGAGTGTVCFGYKGGIGTSSRVLPEKTGGYTVGVLVQSNFGGVLQIAGVEVGKKLGHYSDSFKYTPDGSCMIVVMTDAPLHSRNLERLAKRAMLGLARTGGIASNGSGDYVIAVSTAEECRIPYTSDAPVQTVPTLRNEAMTPLFLAVIEATEEAILNSLFAAETMTGYKGHTIETLSKEKVLQLLREAGKIK
ncbi:P1 family peptidase [Allomuricauda sp. SCSIO 65647]|uniref:DmpA family aminopeptidase n=1 Tax=Allomuricauda sp. SCSIO 65647 TaxID=2908843 RepID=UPI001F490510|nr:P1 family peptidase [Muricauda sp. SCSIO 65647]UJH68924.1 P1 family peptidase [Muricauda sp. SCSIO 65647]